MAFCRRDLGVLVITAAISCANAAQAEERNLEFRVCARPSNVPAWWKMWSYMGNRPAFETTERKEFDAKTEGLAVFIFDPEAPPNSVRVLPIPYNQLTCPPPPPKPEPHPRPLCANRLAAQGLQREENDGLSIYPPSKKKPSRFEFEGVWV